MITSEQTIVQNPDLVRGMIAAFLKGLQDTMADPEAAYETSKKYVDGLADADAPVQKEVLKRSIGLWQTSRPGFSDPQSWQNMQDTLLKMGLLAVPLELDQAFTNDFLP